MRNDKTGGSGGKRRGAAPARVEVHPAAGKAARGMMTDMAAEFDRWMADEVEELAESVRAASVSAESPPVGSYLHDLARQLARQADMLGYPEIARIAHRLCQQLDPDRKAMRLDFGEIDLRISELRDLLKH